MLKLLSKLRQKTGRHNKVLREQNLIPAVLYGHKVKNINLSIKESDFERVYKQAGESTLIKLSIKDDKNEKEKERIVLIYNVEKDAVSDKVIHVDFYQVKMDEEISVEVPLVFIGKSDAVETDKGVLIKNIQVVEIEALPQDLPSEIEVDISVLKTFDDNIYIKDLKIPEKAKIKNNQEDSVASVIPPRTSAELENLEEAPVEKIEDIEKEDKKSETTEESSESNKDVQGGKPTGEESASSGK
ncbi:MAG: 50S ribosomal protein L25 [Patescibacteria group bacterium]|nr:50S ribosomal protein L25 [Patescibacteria group bacterium]